MLHFFINSYTLFSGFRLFVDFMYCIFGKKDHLISIYTSFPAKALKSLIIHICVVIGVVRRSSCDGLSGTSMLCQNRSRVYDRANHACHTTHVSGLSTRLCQTAQR